MVFSASSINTPPVLLAGCEELCPGCRHRGWPRAQSENQKQHWIESRVGSPLGIVVSPIEKCSRDDQRVDYRERACLRAQWNSEHQRWILGFLPAGDPRKVGDRVIEIPHCPVHSERVRQVHQLLSRELPKQVNGRELPLSFVVISGGFLTFVLKCRPCEDFDSLAKLSPAGIQGIFINFNAAAGNRVLSSRGWRHIWGERFLTDSRQIYYGPDSFQQLITSLYESSLKRSQEFLAPAAGDVVLDFYSGSGSTLEIWRQAGAHCLGVELGSEAVACAEKKLGPGFVLRGKTSERLPQIGTWLEEHQRHQVAFSESLLYVNPPRTGLEQEVLSWIKAVYRPARMAYLSCSAGTLSRDLCVLQNSGYAIRDVIPYDFFPQTHHVEALALLERVS